MHEEWRGQQIKENLEEKGERKKKKKGRERLMEAL